MCCYHIGILHWKLTVMYVTFYRSQLMTDTVFRCRSAVCYLFAYLQWYGMCLWSSTFCKDSSYSWLSLAPGRFGAACACSLDCSVTCRHKGQRQQWTHILLSCVQDRQFAADIVRLPEVYRRETGIRVNLSLYWFCCRLCQWENQGVIVSGRLYSILCVFTLTLEYVYLALSFTDNGYSTLKVM
jgi:hypothetical protein